MPPFKRPRYTVYVNTPDEALPVAHDVTITWGDQLKAETLQERLGITNTMGAHLATLWAWCALTRTGAYKDKFQPFKLTDCAFIDQHDDPDPAEDGDVEAGADPMDPPTP